MKRVIIAACLVLFFLPFLDSTIIFYEEPVGLYNRGEIISVNFSIENNFLISDFVETSLQCGSEKFVVSKNYVEIEADVKKYLQFDFPSPIKGNCRFFVNFNDEEVSTNEFKISDKILIDYELNDLSFSSGENLSIKISAKKENKESFRGIATISINGIFEKSMEINNAENIFNFNIAENTPPGNYELIIQVVDKDWKGEVLNSGKEIARISVEASPTSILIDAEENFKPPYNLSFRANLLDQSGNLITNETLIVKIFNPLNELVFEKDVKSGDTNFYYFSEDSEKGGWRINSYYGSVFSTKSLYVDANKQVMVIIEGNSALIRNIGNVFYEGVISLDIFNESFEEEIFINVSLPVRGTFSYPLDFAGIYNITFEGEEFENIRLTGASIFIPSELSLRSYILGFSILFACVFGFLFRKKIYRLVKKIFLKEKKKKSVSSMRTSSSPVSEKTKVCMIFLEFDRPLEMDDLFDAYGFSFKKTGEKVGYVLFYSSSEKNPEAKMFDFARKIKSEAFEKKVKVSIVINSVPFEGIENLKSFASFNRKLLNYSEGKILIPKKVFKRIGVHSPRVIENFDILGESVETYVI